MKMPNIGRLTSWFDEYNTVAAIGTSIFGIVIVSLCCWHTLCGDVLMGMLFGVTFLLFTRLFYLPFKKGRHR